MKFEVDVDKKELVVKEGGTAGELFGILTALFVGGSWKHVKIVKELQTSEPMLFIKEPFDILKK